MLQAGNLHIVHVGAAPLNQTPVLAPLDARADDLRKNRRSGHGYLPPSRTGTPDNRLSPTLAPVWGGPDGCPICGDPLAAVSDAVAARPVLFAAYWIALTMCW